MAEEVNTGGLKKFDYSIENERRLDEDEKEEIVKAYKLAYERKKKEKVRKILLIILIVFLIVSVGLIAKIYLF